MKPMSSNENIQELANQARVLESYLSEIQSRENLSMKIITETRASLESLKSLKDIDNVETIFNMGGGISIKSNIEKPDTLMVNVGAGVVIEKNVADSIQFLEEKLKELETAFTALISQKNEISKQYNLLRNSLNQLIQN
tara:strand:- start:20 stop:436 length:417 start_codon:yes stop_codon:yes gene_type:complete